jgi:hypothetical protein
MQNLSENSLLLQATRGNFIEQRQHTILYILWDYLLASLLLPAMERNLKLRYTNQYYVLLHMVEKPGH